MMSIVSVMTVGHLMTTWGTLAIVEDLGDVSTIGAQGRRLIAFLLERLVARPRRRPRVNVTSAL